MEEYLLWSIIGGTGAILFVFLCYMGFFTKVTCFVEEAPEITVAYQNFEGPYYKMDSECTEFKRKLEELAPDYHHSKEYVYLYYDDPKFMGKHGKWSVGVVISEEIVNELRDSNISIACIPKSQVLRCTFPYRNFLSFGLGARKGFDSMFAVVNEKHLEVTFPPMEKYDESRNILQYCLYLENVDVLKSMSDNPFQSTH